MNSPTRSKNPPPSRDHSISLFWGRFLVGLIGLGIIISTHWMAISAEKLWEHVWESVGHRLGGGVSLGLLAVSSLAFLVLTWAAYGLRRFITGPRLRTFVHAQEVPRSVAVCLVSSEDFREGRSRLEETVDDEGRSTGWKLDGKPYLDLATLAAGPAARLCAAIDACPAALPWPWQQLLRGLQPHMGTLQEIWLVGSRGQKGSFKLLPKCRRFLSALLGGEVTIHVEDMGRDSAMLSDAEAEQRKDLALDFEDFDALRDRLSLLPPVLDRPAQVVLDVTGGQKTTSIVGAALTLNSDAVFQYVQTSPPFDVLTYDAVWVDRPHGAEH